MPLLRLIVELPAGVPAPALRELLAERGIMVHCCSPAAGATPHTSPHPPEVRLAPAERAVLKAFAHCDSNKEIALLLGVGDATVKTYIERLYRKLGVASRARALARALQLGLITVEELGGEEQDAGVSARRRSGGARRAI